MEALYIVIILVSCVGVFFLNKKNTKEKIIALGYALVGLSVMFIPMCWWKQIIGMIVFIGCFIALNDDGSLNPKKTASFPIGIMMCLNILLKIIFIDWIGWNISWLLLIITSYWCFEYVNFMRKL